MPPSPWQGYMMRGFPPWLFSPTSRQLLVPSFFICGVGGREVSGEENGGGERRGKEGEKERKRRRERGEEGKRGERVEKEGGKRRSRGEKGQE